MFSSLSFESRTVQVGAAWTLRVLVLDDTGVPGDAPQITVTLPDGTTGTPEVMGSTSYGGVYRSVYFPAVPGRHVATATSADHGTLSWVANVLAVVPNADMPDVAAVEAYMGDTSYTDAQIAQALDQEREAQLRVCRVPATYPADLAGALLRRTQRALALRHLSLAVKESVDGESQMVVPGNDPEVRRLERPWRKALIG